MMIQNGFKKKKFFGIKRKVKARNFHEVFGTTTPIEDFNLDSGLTDYNQNEPNKVFNTPAQPNGCTGMTTADVMTDLKHIIFSPYFCYEKTCQMEGQPATLPCDMATALNEPHVCGLLALGESSDTQALVHATEEWFEVTPLNGSLFQGILSAMSVGKSSISFASTWYQSFENDVNGIIVFASGPSVNHNWKLCGQKTINGVPYLIGKPWLGAFWGDNGFCYFPQRIIDALDGQAFTPVESPSSDTHVPLTTTGIIESLVNLIKDLIGIQPVLGNTMFDQLEEKIQSIEKELTQLTHHSMPNEPVNTPSENQPSPVATSSDTDEVTYPWDTPNHCYHNTRVLCDQMGLTLEEKNTLCACIYQESQFSTQAKHENLNADGTVSSTDWGIVQVNDYFHIAPTGTPFASVADVLSNPEADVKWMIECYKNGQLSMWDSYLTGAYRQWLSTGSPMWALANQN